MVSIMDENKNLPVIHLELTTGVFKIKAEDAVYEIEVKADSSLAQVVEKIVEKEVVVEKDTKKEPESTKEAAEEGVSDQFYKEISEEMFNEIGKMARDLSISIKTPLDEDMKNVDISQAGVDLEGAKGKLHDIVEMTEKATMEIMDISENIQEGCDEIKKNLTEIQKIDFIGRLEKEAQEEAPSESNHELSVEDIDAVIDREEKLKQELLNLPLQPAAEEIKESEPEPETKTVKVYSFDVDVVFQTLYELCTNEQVKSHIKSMRGEVNNAFAIDDVLKDFSEMAPTVDVEDNFFNFSLPDILKILFKHSKEENYKKTLKKMHQSAANIFLDQILSIEGSVEEKEVQVEKKAEEPKVNNDSPASSDNPLTGMIKLIDENIEKLKAHRDKLSNMPVGSSTAFSEQILQKDEQEKLIDAIESTDKLIKNIIINISRILESLSFQDLSGQQIKKILSVLSSVQVQLLSMLVTFGVKLKKKDEYESLAVGEKEDLVHQEVDKMKSKVSEEWEAEEEGDGPLNQNAVDDLLADLGF
jgi:chemotaxis regulatin CheY-phosphate phosphatase CheZ